MQARKASLAGTSFKASRPKVAKGSWHFLERSALLFHSKLTSLVQASFRFVFMTFGGFSILHEKILHSLGTVFCKVLFCL